jgi:hypothetical protein
MRTTVVLPTRVENHARLLSRHLTVYIFVVVLAIVGAFAYKLRTSTVFACQADGYNADQYLAYCNGANYADYEHGAFAFDLEPAALNFAANADVLFLGNSHLQVAFSTVATSDWSSASRERYYLLGFSYSENMIFAELILSKIHPRARVYIINVDDFFVRSETSPMKEILHDPEARHRYEDKRFWQRVHEPICHAFTALCGNDFAIFRSRETGAFTKRTDREKVMPVSYDEDINHDVVSSDAAAAADFLSRLPRQGCVILTTIPTVVTRIGDANAIAKALGLNLVIPGNLEGLQTYDGSHLDRPSAERWSQAFFKIAGPKILSCIQKQGTAQP